MMNGPLKFLTARKILPLLDLLAKFKQVFACSCSPNFCVARKLAKQIFYFCSCSHKIAVQGMLANARKDHSSPLVVCLSTCCIRSSLRKQPTFLDAITGFSPKRRGGVWKCRLYSQAMHVPVVVFFFYNSFTFFSTTFPFL